MLVSRRGFRWRALVRRCTRLSADLPRAQHSRRPRAVSIWSVDGYPLIATKDIWNPSISLGEGERDG
jgi:hypothetical protein